MSTAHEILKQYWGYDSFRPLQEEIIQTVLAEKDCLALLPTGGGKSLCFQVPAMTQPGLCLVISPLIALMKDQVENLRKKNITAFSIHSGLNRKEVVDVLFLAGHSNCKFLYVSPERLETNLFKEYLPSLGVSLIAVDEAHCISQWGYDFRPSYLKIAALREELPGIPVLALTASATEAVQKDICDKLLFGEHQVFRQSFSRPNLSYSAFQTPSKINKILEIFNKVEGTGIVYCKSRKRTREISDLLNMHGIGADYYHAGLTTEQRSEKQEAWLKNHTRIMVCTNAFGMGIDKPEVRAVIHADVPECLENYYQEAGRAGRDGKKSYAVLLYDETEIDDLKASVDTRFPAIDEIRKIYGALMNHLQIASGTGEGMHFELELHHFTRQFGLNTIMVLSVFKTLEQEELLYFSEQVFVPSRLQIISGKEQLNELESYFPALEPLVKTLLRTYEGILDQPVNIYERMLAIAMRKNVKEVTEQLYQLQQHGIVVYAPQKDKPQVYLVKNRVISGDLQIDMINYLERKKQFVQRMKVMADYVHTADVCRSVFIGRHFGDRTIKECGICDVCLNIKKEPLHPEEFKTIYEKIMQILRPAPLSMQEILRQLNDVPKDKAKEVIRFLQAEEKIAVTSKGQIGLR